jgi:hypothetical protein
MGWGRWLRRAAADNLRVVVVAVVLVAALGGYLTYAAHVDPGSTMETRETARWESSGAFDHRATVVNDTDVYETGTVLENRSVYYTRLTPRLNGSFTYGYTASDGGSLATNTTVSLVMRSVSTDRDGNRTVYWSVEERLNQRRAESLTPGDRARTPFSTNVTAAIERAQRIDERLGGTPGDVGVALVARTTVTGTRNGQQVDATRTYRLPIVAEGGTYRVEDPGSVTESGGQTERVRVAVDRGPLWTVGGPLLGVLAVAALAGLVVGKRRGTLSVSTGERAWLAYRSERDEFDEWITTGRVPETAVGSTVVDVDSLEGLVDVAIDTNNRVIEDERRNACLVLTENCWYRYERPTEPDHETASDEPADPLDDADQHEE